MATSDTDTYSPTFMGRLMNESADGVLSNASERIRNSPPIDRAGDCQSSFELVIIALTLPLWTFITLYLLLLLIHYLRRTQYFSLYDKCTPRNAHFRYDFHIIVGKHSSNFNRSESYIILDLLDNQMISTMSIQIPTPTVFNDHQVFVYRHSRADLRCINFTVYRRHPIKDVRCVRIAHTCSNTDSRIYIYGIDLHDQTNGESRFFPILSAIKYRGTQWALQTTFEPKADTNFKKIGVDCYDPFGYSLWPTYLEVLTILLYIWCSAFCFGHLIGVKEISGSIPLHALTIVFITATSAAALCFVYLRFIKTHIIDIHYDSFWWMLAQFLYILIVMGVSLGFWSLALNQSNQCMDESIQWLISTSACSAFLTIATIITWLAFDCKRRATDKAVQLETDTTLAKTNSRENIEFVADPRPGMCSQLFTHQASGAPSGQSIKHDTSRTAKAASQAGEAKKMVRTKSSGKNEKRSNERQPHQPPRQTIKIADDETLDNAFANSSRYMKARNRNSISQYV